MKEFMSDTCQARESSPRLQQRSHIRQRVQFSCIQLEDDNGGIILDASEGGMAVQTVRSLEGNEFLQMRFQFSQCRNWIESQGRIAWVSPSNKIAGIAFVDLSDEAREEIRKWIGLAGQACAHQIEKLPSMETRPIRRAPAATKLASSEASGAGTPRQNVDVQSARSKPDRNIARKEHPLMEVSSQQAGGEIGSYGLRPAPAARPSAIPSVKRIALILTTLALVLLGTFSFRYEHEGSRSLVSVADQARIRLKAWMMKGDILVGMIVREFAQTITSRVEAALPVTPAAPARLQTRNSVFPEADHPSESVRNSGSLDAVPAVAEKSPQPDPPVDTDPTPRITESASVETADRSVRQPTKNGQAELDSALQLLDKTNAQHDDVKAGRLLWLGVQKGNGEAEVQLAGLYLRGQGVSKNCEQGHILLEAARLKQVVTATQEQSELSLNGCN
jgi:hypothetical protein